MPAPKTIRQKLVDAIVARMQTILISGGYQTDIGTNVADWQTHWQEDELPALSVFDLNNDSEKDHFEAQRQKNQLEVEIRGFLKSSTRPADARIMIGDVVKAIGTDPRWHVTVSGRQVGLAVETAPVRDGFDIDKNDFEVVGFSVRILIEFYSNTFDAYE